MQHLISIIMPALNAGKYIAQSIGSVIDQTYVNWELIIVDDGSTDDTADIVRGLAAHDARVNYVFRENGGQAAARNTGIRMSQGSLIAFLDADDLWVKEKLDLQIRALEETTADLISSNGFVFRDDFTTTEAYELATVPGKTSGPEMFNLLYSFNRIQIQSVLVWKIWLEKVQLFDEDRKYQNCEDYDLWLSLARSGAVFYGMEQKLIKYRRHAAASTHEESNVLRPMIAVIKKHSSGESVSANQVGMRIRNLYRNLIASLVEENKIAEAKQSLEEFTAWEGGGLIVRLQKILLSMWPRKFNLISRECLFRIEWHINRIFGHSSA
jgi:teichuronic acid biosynthesis glycosyltransferase TuaG